MGYMMGSTGSAAGVWSLIVIAVAVVALITAGRLGLFRRGRRNGAPQTHDMEDKDTPGEILRRRYAAGEIDEDEYLRRLSGLSQR